MPSLRRLGIPGEEELTGKGRFQQIRLRKRDGSPTRAARSSG
jgi:hypothetical protein